MRLTVTIALRDKDGNEFSRSYVYEAGLPPAQFADQAAYSLYNNIDPLLEDLFKQANTPALPPANANAPAALPDVPPVQAT